MLTREVRTTPPTQVSSTVDPMSLEVLCQSCGLCCDGSLFARVPLNTSEQVPEVKLAVVTNGFGGRHVPQRCAALEGTVCQVYAERPLACRRYECLLFAALRGGEVSLVDAQEVVQRAQAIVVAARADSSRRVERDEFLSFHFGRRS